MEEMPLSKEKITFVLKEFVPGILIQLLLNGMIDKSKISDPDYLWSKVINDMGEILGDIFYIVNAHKDFLEIAKIAIDTNKQMVAVVLISTTVEHILNCHYRYFMRLSGFTDEDITKIIKNNNFDDKTGWLMTLIFKTELEPNLKRNIKNLIDIRNAIIHYKAVPFKLDDAIRTDSHSIIENQIKNLDFDMLAIPEELEEALNAQLIKLNPDLNLVDEMMEVMFKDTNE
jgi:hypothetical protein